MTPAWRCADSFSLREFFGFKITEATPDYSSLTGIRQQLPLSVHEKVFTFVLRIVSEELPLIGLDICIDSIMTEANAVMKSIVRKETGGSPTIRQEEATGSESQPELRPLQTGIDLCLKTENETTHCQYPV